MEASLTVCFIGDGSHAERLKRALSELGVKYSIIDFDKNATILEQEEVLRSNVAFITSPNDTHAYYLLELSKNFNGYIYCEKPPINRPEDLYVFEEIDFNKCFFGFNHRFSIIHDFISSTQDKFNLGNILNTNIHMSYPFALKKEYVDSWKSDRLKAPNGVLENLGVHYIDMAFSLSGNIENIHKATSNVAGTGTNSDTATIFCNHTNGSTSHIFVSYASSFREEMYFTFEQGDISYDGKVLNLYFPTTSFNKNGLSVRPPIALTEIIDSQTAYRHSVTTCIGQFIKVVLNEGKFSHDLFKQSEIVVSAMLK